MGDRHDSLHQVLSAIGQGAKTIPAIAGNSGLAQRTVYERLAYLRKHHQRIACCPLMAGPDGVSPRVQIPHKFGGDTYAAVVARLNDGESQVGIARAVGISRARVCQIARAERERPAREAAARSSAAAREARIRMEMAQMMGRG